MNSAPAMVLVAVILMFGLTSCGDALDADEGGADWTQTCTPGEAFAAADGCNTCQCPESGLKSEGSCSAMGCEPAPYNGCEGLPCGAVNCNICDPEDPDCLAIGAATVCNVAGECVTGDQDTADCAAGDLCEGVVCDPVEPYCVDEVSLFGGGQPMCDPETGECGAIGGAPYDCSLDGATCEEGACVGGALCSGVDCTVPDTAFCEGNIATTTNGVGYCDAATGTCYWDVMQQEDCADAGLVCLNGACVSGGADLCAGVDCTVPDTAVCNGSIATTTDGVGACDAATGNCYWDPIQQVDCAAQGSECVEGACVGDTCVPNEVYHFLDEEGCHSCKCPMSGIKADAACTLTSDLTVCGVDEDLCAVVNCQPIEPFCDGVTAYAASPTSCDPETGACEPTLQALPKDCSALGEICFQGDCVPEGSDLCDLAQCDGTPPQCSGDVAVGATSEWCEPTTGECTPLPGVFVQDCAAIGLTCADGQCI
jgi:hypothetical protein